MADGALDAADIIERVLDALKRNPHARAQIMRTAQQQRDRLTACLSDHLPSQGPVVIVDIGWGGTIQAMLARLMAEAGIDRPLVGLYLATAAHAEPLRLDGLHLEGYLAQDGDPGDLLAPVLRSPEILEQVCMSDTGSLTTFDADGRPELTPERLPRYQVAQKLAVQQGIRAFQDIWLAYRHRYPALDLSTSHARHQLLIMLSRLMSRPTEEEALAFGSWQHDDNFGVAGLEPMIDELTLDRVRDLSPHGISALVMRDTFWAAGAARLTNPAAGAVASAALIGRLGATEASEPNELGDVEVYVDEGDDFHNGPKDIVRSFVVGNGRTLIRSRQPVRRVHRVRIDPTNVSGLLRLDRLRVALYTADSSSPRVVELRSFDVPEFAVGGARWVGDRVLEVMTDDPMLVLDLRDGEHAEVAGRAHMVEVELSFAGLPLPGGLALGAAPATPARSAALWRRAASRALREGRRLADRLEGRST
jgi:hypothetical protein